MATLNSYLSLNTDELMRTAMRRSGLSEFGDPLSKSALEVLTASLGAEANLSFWGRILTRHYLLELIENRLRLIDHWRRHPEIPRCPIPRPLFITGLPRSGTTLLHNLLAQDPANRACTHWEAMLPWPPPEEETLHTDPRIAQTARRLRWSRLLAPKLARAHPMGAEMPQECVAVMAYSFLSPGFDEMYRVPSYRSWLRAQDLRPAYRFHRTFLGHLQWKTSARRWVLKAPSHMLALDAIFAIYPDVCVVQSHRDPVKVLGSVASLSNIVQGMFSNRINPLEIGAEVCRSLHDEVGRGMAFRDHNPHLEPHFVDVHYSRLVRDPLHTVKEIYDRFGLSLSAEAEHKMRDWLSRAAGARRKRHVYRLKDFGLDAREVALRFAGYRERFAIEPEVL